MTIVKLNVSNAHVTEQHINKDVEVQIQSVSLSLRRYTKVTGVLLALTYTVWHSHSVCRQRRSAMAISAFAGP